MTVRALLLGTATLLAVPSAFAQANADPTLGATYQSATSQKSQILAATSDHRVQAPGDFLGVFAAVSGPAGLALASDGDVLVQERFGNGRTLSFDAATGASTGVFAAGQGSFSYGVSVAPNGNVIVSEGNDGNAHVFAADGTFLFDTGSVAAEVFYNTVRTDGDIFLAANTQVVHIDGATGTVVTSSFLQGSLPDLAYGITFGPGGDLFVSGFFSANVLRYDGQTGAFIDEFVPAGTLVNGGVPTFGPDGNLYVSDRSGNRVNAYDGADGSFLGTFASANGLDGAEGILFLDGEMLVASRESDQVLRFVAPEADGGEEPLVTGSLGYGTCPEALPLGRFACRVQATGTFNGEQGQRYTFFLRIAETGRVAFRGEVKPQAGQSLSQSVQFRTLASDPASFTLEMVVEEGSVGAPSGAAEVLASLPFTKGAALRANEALTVFPNPATDAATLRFAVAEQTEATLAVYDALGREVSRLVDGTVSGSVEASFDAAGLPAGLYVARLTTGAGSETVRLSVVR